MGMGPDTVVHLSDTDIEIIDILSDVGLKSGEARVLVVLFKGYDLTSRELSGYQISGSQKSVSQ